MNQNQNSLLVIHQLTYIYQGMTYIHHKMKDENGL